jgi:mono/diheme cytochrome c family protein
MNAPDNQPAAAASRRWLPAWLIVLVALLGFRGCLFMDEHGAAFSRTVYAPWKSETDFTRIAPPKDDNAFGKMVYTMSCAPCHQVSGLGAPGVAPPLAGSEWVTAEGPNRIIRIVLHGVAGPMKVKGVDWNLAMVPWKDSLDDKQIAAAISFIRQNKEWGHNASPVTPEQVAKIRKETDSRATAWTEAELLQVPVKD